MKILIFSDTHLTHKFDSEKFSFLTKIISQSDQVIINGDFWDSWFTTFDQFVNSKWNKLFPLLLEKKTVYLFGNHDPAHKCNNCVGLFSITAQENFDLIIKDKKFHIEHGHKILFGKRSKILEFYSLLLKKVDRNELGKLPYNCLHYLEYLGYKLLGTTFMTQSKVAKKNNMILKNNKQANNFLLSADTHCSELTIEDSFANSGCINYNFASYLLIEDEKITLHQEKY